MAHVTYIMTYKIWVYLSIREIHQRVETPVYLPKEFYDFIYFISYCIANHVKATAAKLVKPTLLIYIYI